MTSSGDDTVGSLVAALLTTFPAAWAEAWDRVGLIAGAPETPVTGVLVTLDATAEAVARAASLSANVLVTHHPPFLNPPETLTAGAGPAGTLEAATRLGVSVVSLHTNLDRSPVGASALPVALGLTVGEPLESSSEEISLIVTYAPSGAIEQLRQTMAEAGAGRIGSYEGCAFTSSGTGHFVPLPGATPVAPDSGSGVGEVRLEMVAPRGLATLVMEAARASHPYEEPVVLAFDGVRPRGAARLGRLCTWRTGATTGELARHVARTIGGSCRVWGASDRPAGRIAVINGSSGSMLATARSTSDTLIAGEVRYHDALAAVADGLSIIEAGHDLTEWPLVPVLAGAVQESVSQSLSVHVEHASASWWTTEEPNV